MQEQGLTPAQLERLALDVQKMQLLREWARMPGFKIYREALEIELQDKQHAWLKGDDKEARLARVRAQGVQKALDILKQMILVGENSARIIAGETSTPQ